MTLQMQGLWLLLNALLSLNITWYLFLWIILQCTKYNSHTRRVLREKTIADFIASQLKEYKSSFNTMRANEMLRLPVSVCFPFICGPFESDKLNVSLGCCCCAFCSNSNPFGSNVKIINEICTEQRMLHNHFRIILGWQVGINVKPFVTFTFYSCLQCVSDFDIFDTVCSGLVRPGNFCKRFRAVQSTWE